MMAKDVQLAVRITVEMRHEIKKAAEATNRSMASYMIHAIAMALRADGYMKG